MSKEIQAVGDGTMLCAHRAFRSTLALQKKYQVDSNRKKNISALDLNYII